MGCWGEYPFQHDQALDYWALLRDPKSTLPSPVQQLVSAIFEAQTLEYVDDDVTQEILVGVVLILGFTDRQWLQDYPHLNDHLRQQIEEFLTENQADWDTLLKQTPDVYSQSLTAMDKVTSPEISESYELWEGDKTWLASCDELKQALRKHIN